MPDNADNSSLPSFWLDEEGRDHTARFNFYRFCQLIERATGSRLGTGRTPESDPVRFCPNPHLGFPTGELKRTETAPDNPDAPPTVRTNFLGLYGVDSPLPTAYIDDINQGREGADAMAAFLDIFNHRLMTQFYRIWRKYSYPATFEDGGTDNISQCLMALTGIAHSRDLPPSRLLAILQPMLHPVHTAEGMAAVIRSQAPHTAVQVIPHHPVTMPVAKRARLSVHGSMTLDENPILGDETSVAGYCSRVELRTEDPGEARGWMPDGQLREDVMALLRAYLGCDYDVRLWLTIPTRLLPVPRLGDPGLFSGYNMMLGLRDDNLDQMPKTTRMKVGRLREENGAFGKT
ncbi:type VI secretion system baseplate subunit TssG [Salmonella enterica subsp. enterica serovar Virchow]|nr:type VI secretion system baseplate subunit TssG [Salmonella enterica subsp. enterica serovar Virchow]